MIVFSLSLGAIASGAMVANHYPYTVLSIAAGVNMYDAEGNFANVSSGFWFAFDFNGNTNSLAPRKTRSAWV